MINNRIIGKIILISIFINSLNLLSFYILEKLCNFSHVLKSKCINNSKFIFAYYYIWQGYNKPSLLLLTLFVFKLLISLKQSN